MDKINELIITMLMYVQNAATRLRRHAAQAQQGQSLIEYALILAFLAIVIIVALKLLQPAVAGTFNRVTDCLNSSGTPIPAGSTPTPCT